MAEEGSKITVKKPSTQKPRQPMTLTGTAPPGTAVKIKPKWKGAQLSPETDLTTRALEDGRWVMGNVRAPREEGVFKIEVEEQQSVESTPATTTTTFAVKGPRR